MADWITPALTDTYANFLAFLKDRDTDLAKWFDGTTETNLPVGAKRWNAAGATFESWNGTAWVALAAIYNIKAATAGTADTVGGYGPSSLRNDLLIPTATRMMFYQASAPFGWTQVTTQNDKALRVVNAAGGGSGGTHPFSSPPSTQHNHTGPSHSHSGPNHSHTYTQVLNHTHGISINDPGHGHSVTSANTGAVNQGMTTFANPQVSSGGYDGARGQLLTLGGAGTGVSASSGNPAGGVAAGTTGAGGTGQTGSSGTGTTSGNGPTAFAPQYIDVIICQKN